MALNLYDAGVEEAVEKAKQARLQQKQQRALEAKEQEQVPEVAAEAVAAQVEAEEHTASSTKDPWYLQTQVPENEQRRPAGTPRHSPLSRPDPLVADVDDSAESQQVIDPVDELDADLGISRMHRPSKAAAYRYPAAPLTEDRLEEEEAQEIEMVDSEDEEREERGQDQRHQHDGHHWGGLALPPFKRRRLAVQQPPMYELSVMAERQMAELEGLIRRAQEVTRLANPPAELSCPPSLAKEIAVARRTAAALFGCQDLVEGVSPEASTDFINASVSSDSHSAQLDMALKTCVKCSVWNKSHTAQFDNAPKRSVWTKSHTAQLDKAPKRSVWTDSHTAQLDNAPKRSVWTSSHTAQLDKAPKRSVWTSSHTAQLNDAPKRSVWTSSHTAQLDKAPKRSVWTDSHTAQLDNAPKRSVWTSSHTAQLDNAPKRSVWTDSHTAQLDNAPERSVWTNSHTAQLDNAPERSVWTDSHTAQLDNAPERSVWTNSHTAQLDNAPERSDEASAVSLSSLALSAKEENDRPEAIIMSARSSRESPESSADAPSFTCEVCKISVRSAQKLLDHVNFSPLHKAALEGGAGGHHAALSPSGKGRSGHRRLIYDGTKLFWRINETLELCIYEDTGANCVAVTAFTQQESDEVKIAPLQLDRRSVLKAAAADPKQPHIKTAATGPLALPPDVISKYLLARLQAKKETRNGVSVITLGLQKLPDDEVEPVLLAHGAASLVPSDLNVRRRHTFDDVKTAQKQVKEAAVELKQARQQAENLSNLARLTLEAFSKRGNSSHSPTRQSRTDWLRVYDRVSLQTAVAHNKDVLQHVGRSHPESPVKHK
ncbi:hypothetical protein ATCC90586_008514 [Pythium insidiosum]|nr:hypothetical protein ATCC90586_008514 [Pythium insidiosum]